MTLLTEAVGEPLANRGLPCTVVAFHEDDTTGRESAAEFLVQPVPFVQSERKQVLTCDAHVRNSNTSSSPLTMTFARWS